MALTLGKQYVQHDVLRWGFLALDEVSARTHRKHLSDRANAKQARSTGRRHARCQIGNRNVQPAWRARTGLTLRGLPNLLQKGVTLADSRRLGTVRPICTRVNTHHEKAASSAQPQICESLRRVRSRTALTSARSLQRTVVIAMVSVRMVEMTIDEVVDVVAVDYRWVTATGSVDVALVVAGAFMAGRAAVWIDCRYLQHAFIHMVAVNVVQVSVVQVVRMALMLDGEMTASRTMLMLMTFNLLAGIHRSSSSKCQRLHSSALKLVAQ